MSTLRALYKSLRGYIYILSSFDNETSWSVRNRYATCRSKQLYTYTHTYTHAYTYLLDG